MLSSFSLLQRTNLQSSQWLFPNQLKTLYGQAYTYPEFPETPCSCSHLGECRKSYKAHHRGITLVIYLLNMIVPFCLQLSVDTHSDLKAERRIYPLLVCYNFFADTTQIHLVFLGMYAKPENSQYAGNVLCKCDINRCS